MNVIEFDKLREIYKEWLDEEITGEEKQKKLQEFFDFGCSKMGPPEDEKDLFVYLLRNMTNYDIRLPSSERRLYKDKIKTRAKVLNLIKADLDNCKDETKDNYHRLLYMTSLHELTQDYLNRILMENGGKLILNLNLQRIYNRVVANDINLEKNIAKAVTQLNVIYRESNFDNILDLCPESIIEELADFHEWLVDKCSSL